MRARYILPRDRYTPCTRMEGVYLPTYSTIRQTRCYKSWPGVARVVLTRNARWKEMALASRAGKGKKGRARKIQAAGNLEILRTKLQLFILFSEEEKEEDWSWRFERRVCNLTNEYLIFFAKRIEFLERKSSPAKVSRSICSETRHCI